MEGKRTKKTKRRKKNLNLFFSSPPFVLLTLEAAVYQAIWRSGGRISRGAVGRASGAGGAGPGAVPVARAPPDGVSLRAAPVVVALACALGLAIADADQVAVLVVAAVAHLPFFFFFFFF